MNDIIKTLLPYVAMALAAVLAKIIIPYIKANVIAKLDTRVVAFAKTVVQAAEQLFTNGKDKKEYALDLLIKFAVKIGFPITVEEASALIEAFVKELYNK